MAHFCRICGKTQPNEAFSGKGHRIHVCKKCSQMTKKDRERIEQEDEIFGFLKQSYISRKNVTRLKILASSNNSRIAELATIVLEVARVKPYKRRRLKVLAKERKDLLEKLEETGLIFAHHY
jgi:ribosome-binding protein aMBF1 (putative translation factor)